MRKKILHIEDDWDTRLLVKTLLEKQGHIVSNATTLDECRDILSNEDIDLILLDLMLPDTSGWTIHQKIKKNPDNKEVKVVFLSVIPVSDERLDTLKKNGIEDYITKPFDNNDLVARINRILEK